MTEHTCALCPVLRPHYTPYPVERAGGTCGGCPLRLELLLAQLPELHARLGQPEQAPYDDRWYAVLDRQGRMTGERRRRDPLGAVGGAGPVNAPAPGGRVAGTRERSVPARLDVVDLSAPARAEPVRDTMVPAVDLEQVLVRQLQVHWEQGAPQVRETTETRIRRAVRYDDQGQPVLVAAGDQVGHVSVATVLLLWVTDVRDALFPRSPLPAATVTEMARWLQARLDDIIGTFDAAPDLAGEVRAMVGALRSVLGEYEPRPRLLLGVPCQRCDVRSQIVALPGGYRECAGELGCGRLYSPAEWREWMSSDAVRRLLPGAVDDDEM